ncbi:MAG TPA: response regulator transcription factor [Parafilimonas sp.]
MRRIKVVVFEDNKQLRESLSELINSNEEFECVGAFADANNLQHKIERTKPGVVMMDIDMPGMNGIDAVNILHEKFPAIRVLMQTVFDDNDKIFAAIRAGASGYILKKSTPAKIIEALRETFNGGAPMTPSIAEKVLNMFRIQTQQAQAEKIDLSEREKEVLSLLVKGKSYKMIAVECFISIDTVNSHIKNIYEKLHVHSKSEAVVKAINQKLI